MWHGHTFTLRNPPMHHRSPVLLLRCCRLRDEGVACPDLIGRCGTLRGVNAVVACKHKYVSPQRRGESCLLFCMKGFPPELCARRCVIFRTTRSSTLPPSPSHEERGQVTSEAQGEPSIYSSCCSDLSVIATTIASISPHPTPSQPQA